jgi:hypothetical protein
MRRHPPAIAALQVRVPVVAYGGMATTPHRRYPPYSTDNFGPSWIFTGIEAIPPTLPPLAASNGARLRGLGGGCGHEQSTFVFANRRGRRSFSRAPYDVGLIELQSRVGSVLAMWATPPHRQGSTVGALHGQGRPWFPHGLTNLWGLISLCSLQDPDQR